MKKYLFLLVLPVFIHAQNPQKGFNSETSYTAHFGKKVEEKYLWLEDDNDPRVPEWLEYQKLKNSELSKNLEVNRFARWYGEVSYLEREGISHEFKLNLSREIPSTLKYKAKGEAAYQTLLKVKDFSNSDTDFPIVEDYWIDPTERYVLLAVSHSGGDWIELIVFDFLRKTLVYRLKGVIRPEIFFIEGGFIYERYDAPEDEIMDIRKNQRLCIHQFNKPQENEEVIFQNPDKEFKKGFTWLNNGNGKFFVFHPFKVKGEWREAISILDVYSDRTPTPFLIYKSEVSLNFEPLYKKENTLYVRTNLKSSNFEILSFNLEKLNDYGTFVPEYAELLTDAIYLGNDFWGLTYLSYGKYSGVILNKKTKKSISLNIPAGGKPSFHLYDKTNNKIRYSISFHFRRRQFFDIDMSTLVSTHRGNSTGDYFKVELVKFKSRDGKVIPMQLIYDEKKISKGGPHPAMLLVYGGYGDIIEPRYSIERHYFIKNGGILAIPGIRGGGDLGSNWAMAGRGLNKQNSINDAVDASEYLINRKMTDSKNLVITGTSHGAFIAAAAGIERPDLYAGVIAKAGPMDMIRHQYSVGHAELNRKEYGTPEDSLSFLNLHKMSPIHNLKEGVNYPSFLLITGLNDTRVPPASTFRLKALIDEYSENQLNLLHVNKFGHGEEISRKEFFTTLSVKYNFLYLLTGYKFWK